MEQSLLINEGMTHSFLRYAENTHISNQKVLLLIDNLRKGISEEDMLKEQGFYDELRSQVRANVKTCCCIMLHVACLMDTRDDNEQYVNFINNWHQQQGS